jgi:hypothetical protein
MMNVPGTCKSRKDQPAGMTDRSSCARAALGPRPPKFLGNNLGTTYEFAILQRMAASGLDPDLIVVNIDAARERKARALAEYEAATAELSWWLRGADLAGVVVVHDDHEPDSDNVEGVFPSADHFEQSGAQPTLRQAIMAHLRRNPIMTFSVSGLAEALVLRGWLPESGAQKRVSDMVSLMAGDEQLKRVERGVYRLHPRFAVAFEQRPLTDYRRAAEMGLPVPPQHRDKK